MLRVINLSSGYGKLVVVKSASLSVQRGEVVTLIGGNGAGKSTLLKTIAGLLRPVATGVSGTQFPKHREHQTQFPKHREHQTQFPKHQHPAVEGRVLLAGKDVAGKPAEKIARLGLALVPEARDLFPSMTVYENLLIGANANRPKRGELAWRLDSVCGLFPDLKKALKRQAGQLSGGQQQMLALGRALMGEPDILLLDEPSTGLAPVLVAELFGKIAALKEGGMTILLAEQNVHAALEVADRGYVVENGRIVLEESAETLKSSERVQKAYLGI